jgi:hypothetical protein
MLPSSALRESQEGSMAIRGNRTPPGSWGQDAFVVVVRADKA